MDGDILPPLGFRPGVSYEDYAAWPALRWSILRHGLRSMRHLQYALAHPDESESRALVVGRALHCAALEPDAFDDRFIALPGDAPRRPTSAQRNAKKPSAETEAAIEWWAEWIERSGSRDELSPDEADAVARMADAIRNDPVARDIIDLPGHREASVLWRDEATGVACKARPDLMVRVNGETWRFNIKTAASAAWGDFERQAANLAYHCQCAFEGMGLAATAPGDRRSAWLVVEKSPPYCVVVYEPSPAMQRQGARQVRDLVDRYHNSVTNDYWPGYAETIRPLDLPRWAQEMGYDE